MEGGEQYYNQTVSGLVPMFPCLRSNSLYLNMHSFTHTTLILVPLSSELGDSVFPFRHAGTWKGGASTLAQ